WLLVTTNLMCVATVGVTSKYRSVSSGVTGRGLTDGNAFDGDDTICVQPSLIDPSQVGFAATLPARHAYASNERRAVNRLLPGTSSADTPSRFTRTPEAGMSPRPITTQRPWTSTPVWP